MIAGQPGIFAQGTRAHYHLEFDLRPGLTREQIVSHIHRLREPAVTSGGANIVLGFGVDLWRRLAPAEVPQDLKRFEPIDGPGGHAPATPHDLWVWIHGTGHDVELDVARAIALCLEPVAVLAAEQPCFVYRDGRDLTGFVDGTENPAVEIAPEVALLPDGVAGAGGSFVLAQKWLHDLRAFHAQPVAAQEQVIGRTKPASVELADEVKPPTAHIARVVVEDEAGEELEIYRRSVPWGTVEANGLFFLAFSADLTRFERMLARMYGLSGDGVTDHLLRFTRPITGAYYFAPSLQALRSL
jgi:putative iron-dependent peroxidase